MSWRGHDVYDCTTEFRYFWLHSKFKEEYIPSTQAEAVSFQLVAVYDATPQGITAAYKYFQQNNNVYPQDGLYFVHKQTQYILGQTPLALLWKNASCSPYHIDTEADGTTPPRQRVVLQYLGDGRREVGTGDDPPLAVATMPASWIEEIGRKKIRLKVGRLLRFELMGGAGGSGSGSEGQGGICVYWGGSAISDGSSAMIEATASLKFVGAPDQKRGRADMLSKIMFQMMARTRPIGVEELIEAASTSDMEEEVAGGEGGGGGMTGVVHSAVSMLGGGRE